MLFKFRRFNNYFTGEKALTQPQNFNKMIKYYN